MSLKLASRDLAFLPCAAGTIEVWFQGEPNWCCSVPSYSHLWSWALQKLGAIAMPVSSPSKTTGNEKEEEARGFWWFVHDMRIHLCLMCLWHENSLLSLKSYCQWRSSVAVAASMNFISLVVWGLFNTKRFSERGGKRGLLGVLCLFSSLSASGTLFPRLKSNVRSVTTLFFFMYIYFSDGLIAP